MVDCNQTLAEAWQTRQADLDQSSANGKLVIEIKQHDIDVRF